MITLAWVGHEHRPIFLRRELARLEWAPVCLRDQVILRLGLKCGLRPFEIRNQRAEEISFKDRLLYTAPCKDHPSRPIPVDQDTLSLIREYSEGHGVLLRAKDGYESRSGEVLSKVGLYYIVKNAGKVARIPGWRKIYPYILRHYFAASWVLRRGNMEILRRLLGHNSLARTQSYLKKLVWWEDVEQEYAHIVRVRSVMDEKPETLQVQVLQDGGTQGPTRIQVEILTSDRHQALEILKDLNEVLLPTLGKHPDAKLRLKLVPEGEEEPEIES